MFFHRGVFIIEMYFTLESASRHSIRKKNAVNSQTLYFNIFLETILQPFFPSLELCIPSTVYFYSFHTYVTSFTHFTQHFLCIYIARAKYFLIPDDAVDRRKLGF